MKTAQNIGNYIKEHPKVVIYPLIGIGIAVAAYFGIKAVKNFLGKGKKPVDKHDVTGVPTITKDDATSIADRLWDLMNGAFFISFDSMDQYFDAYPGLNEADKTMIYNAFGKRNNGFPFYTEGDLYFWLDRKVKFGIADAKAFWGI
jgi:hypothetical protein